MTQVYVATVGEYGQGGSVLGVYTTKDLAVAGVESYLSTYSDESWYRLSKLTPGTAVAEWENGGDWILITPFDVDPNPSR